MLNGSNVIDSGGGDDSVLVGPFWVFVIDGDPIPVSNGTNVIDAGSGNDTVSVLSTGPTFVRAGDGDDTVLPGGFVSGFFPPAYSNVVNGPMVVDGGGNDLIAGGLGADFIDGGAGNDILFDGTVTVNARFTDSLRQVLTDWNPADPASYAAIRARITVTPDTASWDVLLGGDETDWFWSSDPLDSIDLRPNEVRN